MTILRVFLSLSLAFSLSACFMMPFEAKVDEPTPAEASCKLVTRHLTFQTNPDHEPPHCSDVNCLAGYGYFIAADAVVTGSIVLTGNTVHWLEYQGRCSDGYLNAARERLLASLGVPQPTAAGGSDKDKK